MKKIYVFNNFKKSIKRFTFYRDLFWTNNLSIIINFRIYLFLNLINIKNVLIKKLKNLMSNQISSNTSIAFSKIKINIKILDNIINHYKINILILQEILLNK